MLCFYIVGRLHTNTIEIKLIGKIYLFCEGIGRGEIPISLTVNGGVGTSTNGIHLPMGVIIVHHMKITVPASVRKSGILQFRLLQPFKFLVNTLTIL